jgi:CoA:oxalate CoA-transferase
MMTTVTGMPTDAPDPSPLAPTQGPLSGIRVLDMSQVISGPMCGRVLADLGAEVIKVESPAGDVSRTVRPHIEGLSAYFSHVNAGKRNVCVDLRTDAGTELLRSLASRCDVLLENFRPGVLDARGLGADALRAIDPRLIVCSITGWGRDGPWVHRRAYAPLVHAEIGLLEQAARLRGQAPVQEVHIHGDLYPAFFAANAILAALFMRERTGVGQHLDVSMGEVMLYADEWHSSDLAGLGPQRDFDIWTHPVVEVGDGTGVMLVGTVTRSFAVWVRILGGDPALLTDPRFATYESACEHQAEALTIVRALVAAVPTYAEFERLVEGEPVLVGQMRSTVEVAETEWATQRKVFTEVMPGLRVATAPFRSDGASIGVQGRAAHRGEHTDEVLRDVLGLDPATIEHLVATGVVQRAHA